MNNSTATLNPAQASPLQEDIERLRMDLRALRDDLSSLGADSVAAARARAKVARERLQESARAAADMGRQSIDAAEGQIIKHPFAAVGAALAVGAVLGFAVARKI